MGPQRVRGPIFLDGNCGPRELFAVGAIELFDDLVG